MNKIINESSAKISGLYKGLSYSDQYGTSIFFVIILCIVLFLVYAYFKSRINSQKYRDNWPKYRCNPNVVPFAGTIYLPEGETVAGYTQKNFNFCLNEMLKPVAQQAVNPLDYLMSGLMKVFSVISKAIERIRSLVANLRTRLSKIVRNIFQRILSLLIPIQEMFIRTKDLLGKSLAILKVGLETAVGSYLTFKSSMGVMVTAGAWSLIIGAAVLIALFGMFIAAVLFFPWTLGYVLFMIASFTSAYIVIMVFVLLIITFMGSVMEVRPNLRVAAPPKKPPPPATCFDPNTCVKLENGEYKKIKEIVVGDKLQDGGRVTATFILNSFDQQMFRLGDIIISGTHKVKSNGQWIYVREHPDAMKNTLSNYNEPFLYNLNTTTKEISIGNYVFCDWDEVSDEKCLKLFQELNNYNKLNDIEKSEFLRKNDRSFIHAYFDGGFNKSATVNMNNGISEKIVNVDINDKLSTGGVVYGTVRLDNPNVYSNENLDNLQENELIYHLLVHGESNNFVVNGEDVFDYNHYIESVV